MAIELECCAIAKRIISVFFTMMVAILFVISANFFTANSANAAELVNDESPDSTRQPAASSSSQAINISTTEVSPGRYRIIGTLVDARNQPACGLALASGKCVFSCGPGSPRCEGGTDSLPFGQFDLTNLPTEPNGTINMQTFVSGSMPGLQVINPKGGNTTYTLTVNKAGSGNGSVSGGGSYAAGASVNLYATPATGSTFTGWSPYPPCANSFAMPAYNLTCTATFTASASEGEVIFPYGLISPATGIAGGQINISLTAQNVGGQPVTFTAGLFLSKNRYTVTSSGLIATCNFSLAPGQSDICEGPITIPATTTAGNYYLIAYVQDDWDSAVNTITITSGGCYGSECVPR